MTETVVRVGSRKSKLALWQTEHVVGLLRAAHPAIKFVIETESTHGDDDQTKPLAELGSTNPGLFTKELERSLLAGRTRLAVHSLKDMPTTLPPGLVLGAITEREAPEDAVILHARHRAAAAGAAEGGGGAAGDGLPALELLPPGSVVGTSSLRRQAMIRRAHPTLQVRDIRGNIHTRLGKLDASAGGGGADGGFDAILLAAVGLRRVGLEGRIDATLPPASFPHAVGQGALGVECRGDDAEVLSLLRNPRVHHGPTALRCEAERALLRGLQGGCQIPLAVRSNLEGGASRLHLHARVLSQDGGICIDSSGDTALPLAPAAAGAEAEAGADALAVARALGADVASKLLAQGAARVLQEGTRPITYSTALVDEADAVGEKPAAAAAGE
eukprot:g2983.t1